MTKKKENIEADDVEIKNKNIDVLPPIVINKDGILLDGMHRIKASRTKGTLPKKLKFLNGGN